MLHRSRRHLRLAQLPTTSRGDLPEFTFVNSNQCRVVTRLTKTAVYRPNFVNFTTAQDQAAARYCVRASIAGARPQADCRRLATYETGDNE